MDYYFELGGGLGDIFLRIFNEPEYRTIQNLRPEDKARITLITINPFADELFQWHPKSSQLDVMLCPHWNSEEDLEMRAKYGLPLKSEVSQVSRGSEAIEFYPSPSDVEIVTTFQSHPYFVLAASAGGSWRVFPDYIVSMICQEAVKMGLNIAAIGRNYPEQRGALRHEPPIPPSEYTFDLVDQLSVPGSAKLIEGAAGVICSHTSVCHLAWLINKPVLLLYPWQVYEEHISSPRTGYTLGLDRSTTIHALFEDCTPALIRRFFTKAIQISKTR